MSINIEPADIFNFIIPDFFEQKINELEKVIGMELHNKKLWILAFKHRSYLNVTHEKRVNSNERLEFLGDSVLNITVTHFLYNTYPQQD